MIEKQTIPYEILIRLGAEGYQAAHVIDLERLVDTDTGVVWYEKELPARPITVEAAGTLFGEASVQMAVQIDQLTAELTAETQRANLAETARDQLQAQLDALQATPLAGAVEEEALEEPA